MAAEVFTFYWVQEMWKREERREKKHIVKNHISHLTESLISSTNLTR